MGVKKQKMRTHLIEVGSPEWLLPLPLSYVFHNYVYNMNSTIESFVFLCVCVW